mgnify:FL=1
MSLFSCPTNETQTDRIELSDPCFISDLHLNAESQAQAEFFIRFLHEVGEKHSELVILGDFFDYWVGDDAWESASRILEPLQKWGQSHKLFIMHGNRDFMMGKKLASRLGATLLRDPCVARINTQNVLLSHGDLWCINDHDYQKVRQKVRSFWWQWLVLRLPLSKRLKIAHDARTRSKESKVKKEALLMDVDAPTVADAALQKQCSFVIHGHTHQPGEYALSEELRRFVLPDWRFCAANCFKGGYLTFINATPVLQTFQ